MNLSKELGKYEGGRNIDESMSNFAIFLGDCRVRLDFFSREFVAEKCRVTEKTVYNFEKGKSNNATIMMFYISILHQILDASGADEDYKPLAEIDPVTDEYFRQEHDATKSMKKELINATNRLMGELVTVTNQRF